MLMARYVPEVKVDRRKRLSSPSDIETIRMALLGVFFIMLTFFVALVAGTKPSETRTVNVIASLQNTFTGFAGNEQLEAAPPLPAWLETAEGENQSPPLDDMKRLFPQAFAKDSGNWGAVELRFTPDLFHRFLYTDLTLAKRFFAGFSAAQTLPAEADPYILELDIGMGNKTMEEAQQMLQQTKKELLALDVDDKRILGGFEKDADDIVIRMTPASRYEGAL